MIWELEGHGKKWVSFASVVLFVFPGLWREAGARRALRNCNVLVTAIEYRGWQELTPAQAVLAAVGGTTRGRRPLIELASAYGARGP